MGDQQQKLACKKIGQFLSLKIEEAQKSWAETEKINEKLEWAIAKVTFSKIMSSYLNVHTYLVESYLRLIETYLEAKCYDQAIVEARLALEAVPSINQKQTEQLKLLVVKSVLKKGNFQDAKDILREIKVSHCEEEYLNLEIEILMNLNDEPGTQESLMSLENLVAKNYGENSINYGIFLAKKGKTFGHFERYIQALMEIEKGMEIMIEERYKQKQQIGEIYLMAANFCRKQKKWEKQFTNLICAQAMARQITGNEKQLIFIIHLLCNNLLKQENYEKTISELKRAEELEKQIYGESSTQLAKTVTKIHQLLLQQNMSKQAKKYENQYRRVLGVWDDHKSLPFTQIEQNKN